MCHERWALQEGFYIYFNKYRDKFIKNGKYINCNKLVQFYGNTFSLKGKILQNDSGCSFFDSRWSGLRSDGPRVTKLLYFVVANVATLSESGLFGARPWHILGCKSVLMSVHVIRFFVRRCSRLSRRDVVLMPPEIYDYCPPIVPQF